MFLCLTRKRSLVEFNYMYIQLPHTSCVSYRSLVILGGDPRVSKRLRLVVISMVAKLPDHVGRYLLEPKRKARLLNQFETDSDRLSHLSSLVQPGITTADRL